MKLAPRPYRCDDHCGASIANSAQPPLAWYDVLLELERAPDGLRPVALESALLLAQYNLSRLLNRLAEAGLITRKPHPQDGRGQIIHITRAGLTVRQKMWRYYEAAIQDAVARHLSDAEAATLATLLHRLARPG